MYGLDMVGCTWKFSKQLCSESLHLNHFIFSDVCDCISPKTKHAPTKKVAVQTV